MFGCQTNQKNYVFCNETYISSSKTNGTYPTCLDPDLERFLVASYGQPDSIKRFSNSDSTMRLYYSKSYFQLSGLPTLERLYVINDSFFSVQFNPRLSVQIGDSPKRIVKYFPGSAKKKKNYLVNDSLIVYYAYLKDNVPITTNSYLTFEIKDNKIIRIKFYL